MSYKLLLVDDEQGSVEILQNRLTREGYEVVTALDGEEALAKMKEENPDIVLLDLVLPKKNGMEVLKEIRQSYKDSYSHSSYNSHWQLCPSYFEYRKL